MKHLEETPWFICDKGDENYCAYVDTDSNYFNAEPILKYLYPNFEKLSDKDKDNKLEQVALAYQDIISEDYNRLAKECFNVSSHRLEMKTECVIRSAYFRATRRYAQWITKQEGIVKETLDVKGLEYKKSNFPKLFGDFFKQVVEDFLTFYYAKVRKALSTLEYPKINVDGLGTFFIRKGKLENAIKRNKSMLGNLKKRTYKGYEKTYAINQKLEEMESAIRIIEDNIENKKQFKRKKNANK